VPELASLPALALLAVALLRDETDTKVHARCVEALSRVLDRRSVSRTLLAV